MLRVNWVKSVSGDWLSLEHVNLKGINTFGVYVIWHTGNPSRTVRVGQGDIVDRLCCHREDRAVLAYKKYGELRVTWAAVPPHLVGGVERYLAELLKPRVGDRFPAALPIAVNSPFAAAA